MIKTKVMDADDNEAESKIQVHRHHSDMHNLAEDVGKRVISTLKQNPTGCVYFNPVVTVSCPSPLPEFFRIVRNEQARWCRQAGNTFPQKVRRRASRWIGGGEWISNKHDRYLDRAMCFTGILFIEGQVAPSHSWPKPAGATPTVSPDHRPWPGRIPMHLNQNQESSFSKNTPESEIRRMSIDTINEDMISPEQRTWFNSKGPDAPIAWYGGKHYLARWIIEQMPEHRVYVEPFGGMAGVLLKKEQSEVEVFNDLDGRAVNFFRVIRDRNLFEEFKLHAELTPYSREEFQILCETPEPTEPVQRAWWFFVRCRQARGGTGMGRLTPNAWATSTRTRRQMPEPISKYLSALDGLEDVAHRFRQVMIENTPAIHLIKKYDGPDVLFYCDPPYPASTRSGGKADSYAFEMTDVDHIRLLETLKQCQGRVMISSYDSPLYSDRLDAWTRVEKATHVQFSNSGQDRTEVLWKNW